MTSKKTSPSTGKTYGVKRACEILKTSRATLYRHRAPRSERKSKSGPKPKVPDQKLLELIQADIKTSPFTGEGHRKVHARIRHRNQVCAGRQRVLRLMRENALLSPYRTITQKAKAHDGRITTDGPSVMWATDATKILTVNDGWVWLFSILEHWNAECMGWHVSKRGDRFVAIEALNMALKRCYGSTGQSVAKGLKLRMDHGSQFLSDYFLKQVRYLGITPSMGYVREPEDQWSDREIP